MPPQLVDFSLKDDVESIHKGTSLETYLTQYFPELISKGWVGEVYVKAGDEIIGIGMGAMHFMKTILNYDPGFQGRLFTTKEIDLLTAKGVSRPSSLSNLQIPFIERKLSPNQVTQYRVNPDLEYKVVGCYLINSHEEIKEKAEVRI